MFQIFLTESGISQEVASNQPAPLLTAKEPQGIMGFRIIVEPTRLRVAEWMYPPGGH